MLGAIIGDIAGSKYEFNNTFDYDFVTDAVAVALCDPDGEFIIDHGNMSF